MHNKIYVITCAYYDGAGYQVVMGFASKPRAEHMMALLARQDNGRKYQIEEIEMDETQ